MPRFAVRCWMPRSIVGWIWLDKRRKLRAKRISDALIYKRKVNAQRAATLVDGEVVEVTWTKNGMVTKTSDMQTKEDQEYLLGQAVVYEALAASFQRRAGEAFAANQDDKAEWLRDEANAFALEGATHRKAYFAAGGDKGKPVEKEKNRRPPPVGEGFHKFY